MIFACGKTAQPWMLRFVITFPWIIETTVLRLYVHLTECSILHHFIYIYHIFYTLCLWQWSQKTFIVLEWHSEDALTINRWQCWLGQIFTAFSPQTCALLAVTHDSNRPCHLMLADTITVIWKAVVVLCVQVRCSGHSDLVNCLRGFMEVQLQSRSCQFITTAL